MKKQHQYIALIVCFLLVLLQAGKFLQQANSTRFAQADNRSTVHPLHDTHSEPEITNNRWMHSVLAGTRIQGGAGLYVVAHLNSYRRAARNENIVAGQNNWFFKDYLLLIYPSHNFW